MSADRAQPLGHRGISECRGCVASELDSVLDLGCQPLSNEMGASAEESLPVYPLHLRICPSCGLGQVGEFVLPDRIFGADYPYLSSTSVSWVRHAETYARGMTADLSLGPADLVIEIASNDGYLLSIFQQLGVRTLGVEPASNVAAIAGEAGVPTISEFFSSALAERLVAEFGHPRLVTANNVMAHVPDLQDFVAGLAILCDADTIITVENPSMLSLLVEAQFDTIYHEHFSYLAAHSVRAVAARHGLDLVSVEKLDTHGGSNRYTLRPVGRGAVDSSVSALLSEEKDRGLFDRWVWEEFRQTSLRAVDGLRQWLSDQKAAGTVTVGYGAAAKGNTFLNAVGEEARTLAYVVDGSAEKQGKFMPGSRLPVLEPTEIERDQPDDILVLPWNLAQELSDRVSHLSPSSRCWTALPEMRRLR